MKLAYCHLTLLLLMLPMGSAFAAETKKFPSYSMVLMGGGLSVCSSAQESACVSAPEWSGEAKKHELYLVQPQYISNVAKADNWPADRKPLLQQVVAMLQHLQSKLADAPISQRELSRLWRSSEVEVDGIWVSGRELYRSLSGAELNYIFDQLEIEVKATTGQKERLQEQVAPLQSTDQFSLGLYQQFVELAREVSVKKAPHILVMTASGRDPYASVDYYLSLFKQLGATVSWLPVNAAYQAALRDSGGASAGCNNFSKHLVKEHGSFQRARVYPDLAVQQKEFCLKGSSNALSLISKADAIFINGGDQSLTYKALKQPDGSDTAELAKIRAMLERGQMVLAGTSAGTAVLSGGSYRGQQTVMISNGQSAQAVYQGALARPAPADGCENDRSCGEGVDEKSLTYQPAGLNLFPWGVLDTHFSERGRQGRLLTLVAQTKAGFGFGVDEATALLVGFDPKNADLVRFHVKGSNGVYLAERTEKSHFQPSKLSGMNSHYFTNGDSFSLQQGQLLANFADWKYAPNTSNRPLLNSGNVFGADNYRQLAQLLCGTQSRDASGQFEAAGREYKLKLHRPVEAASRTGQYAVGNVNKTYCSYRNVLVSVEPAQ
jgi:cyanophycinase